jgi:DNA-binding IclR family transcriptional regulator
VPLPEALFVARTMAALELLALHPLSAPQVAEALQVHPRTARRLLTRLADEGWVTRSDDQRRVYAPTMRVVALAGHVVERAQLTTTAQPFVVRLHALADTPAHLMIPSYRCALCLVHADGHGDAEVRPELRELVPSHATAPGKALLGSRRPWRESVLSGRLTRHTPRTLTDPVALGRELEATAERGWATEDGEHRPGVRAVAAPVFTPGAGAAAAIGAELPPGATFDEMGERVSAVARELSAALGAGDASR